MTIASFDIAILGAGPVGRVLALMLARVASPATRIALLQTADAPSPSPSSSTDPRVLAMNQGSRVLLESLDAWPAQAADIQHIHVSQRGRLGRSLIQHSDFNVPQLGSVVTYTALHAQLSARVLACGVTCLTGPPARILAQDAEGVLISQGETRLRCKIAVQSDGVGDDALRRDYNQHALLTSALATLPRKGWAWEQFTSQGPLALLPHPQLPSAYSVVWCCTPERAAALAALDHSAFSRALSETFGERLGRLHSDAPRHVFPLMLHARRTPVQGRIVAIGNAAQTLHPVAGQGLNLGLRDAARLAYAVAHWLPTPNADPSPALATFARARQVDRLLTATLTDFMPRVFSTKLAPVEHACGLALLGLDLSASLRAPLAQHLLHGFRA